MHLTAVVSDKKVQNRPTLVFNSLNILDLLDLDLIDVDGLEGDEDNWLTGPDTKVNIKGVGSNKGKYSAVKNCSNY